TDNRGVAGADNGALVAVCSPYCGRGEVPDRQHVDQSEHRGGQGSGHRSGSSSTGPDPVVDSLPAAQSECFAPSSTAACDLVDGSAITLYDSDQHVPGVDGGCHG